MDDFSAIATAPGDLPPAEIARRFQTILRQFRHENTIRPAVPEPNKPVTLTALAGSGVNIRSAVLYYTTDGSLPASGPDSDGLQGGHEVTAAGSSWGGPNSAADIPASGDPTTWAIDMKKTGYDWVPYGGYVARWEATVPGQAVGTVVRYRIVGMDAEGKEVPAQDGQGFWYRYPPEQGVTTFAYRVPERPLVPGWFQDAVVYQIFVDRFRRLGGFSGTEDLQAKHGGQLAGIEEALPYLEDLGITCIWLSPVNPAPSYHRYDATDLFDVDPVLGDVAAMQSLTAAAHQRGIRVILDFVPSHLSRRHPAFQAAQADRKADTANWFYFYQWPDQYRSFLEAIPALVSINTESAGARQFLIESARFWLQCGIDGFRIDHVIGHGMDFWVQFQEALEAVKPDVVTFGEATDTGDALRRYQGRMNGVLDFPLARALRLTFATGKWNLSELDGFLEAYDGYMADAPSRVSFLDNHDMDRFLYVAEQDRDALLLGLLCLLTLPQVPVLYYGTETGMTQETTMRDRSKGGDALARQDMQWDRDKWDRDLRDRIAGLIRLRRDHIASIAAGRRRLHLDSEAGVYVYEVGAYPGNVYPGGPGTAGADHAAPGTVTGQLYTQASRSPSQSDRTSPGTVRDTPVLAIAFNTSDQPRTWPHAGVGELIFATKEGVRLKPGAVELPPRAGAVIRPVTGAVELPPRAGAVELHEPERSFS